MKPSSFAWFATGVALAALLVTPYALLWAAYFAGGAVLLQRSGA